MTQYDTLGHAVRMGSAPWTQTAPELSDFHVAVFRDLFPVTHGHLLFVPRFNTPAVIRDCFEAAVTEGNRMVTAGECDAFNVGMNSGAAAGQTVMYPHVHLIPRRVGDCADPVGGVRAVVHGQANYHSGGYQLPV
jgi:diadenosine tetraphosphate (Ap4A) HIT family hydrolase